MISLGSECWTSIFLSREVDVEWATSDCPPRVLLKLSILFFVVGDRILGRECNDDSSAVSAILEIKAADKKKKFRGAPISKEKGKKIKKGARALEKDSERR